MPSSDRCDDFVGVLGPGKGLRVCVGVIEEAVDGVFEFAQGSEHAMFEAFHCEFGEEALDGVEPGSGCGGEVEDEARMFLEPRHDIGMLVGGQSPSRAPGDVAGPISPAAPFSLDHEFG